MARCLSVHRESGRGEGAVSVVYSGQADARTERTRRKPPKKSKPTEAAVARFGSPCYAFAAIIVISVMIIGNNHSRYAAHGRGGGVVFQRGERKRSAEAV